MKRQFDYIHSIIVGKERFEEVEQVKNAIKGHFDPFSVNRVTGM